MARISEEDVQACYEVARAVASEALAEAVGVRSLVKDRDMNPASASDYIRNLRQMLNGKTYHRTLNDYATEYYIRGIHRDYGSSAAQRAMAALRGHIVYYEGIRGSQRLSLRRLSRLLEQEFGGATLESEQVALLAEIEASKALSPKQRAEAAKNYPKLPQKLKIVSTIFQRNPHVVAAVLERAEGKMRELLPIRSLHARE